MLDRLREIVDQRCQDWDGELVEFNGETDHVHILASHPPNLDRSRFVNNVKTTSSRLIRRDFGRELRVAGLLSGLAPTASSRAAVPHCRCSSSTWSSRRRRSNPALGRGTAFTPSLALRAQTGALAARSVGVLFC